LDQTIEGFKRLVDELMKKMILVLISLVLLVDLLKA